MKKSDAYLKKTSSHLFTITYFILLQKFSNSFFSAKLLKYEDFFPCGIGLKEEIDFFKGIYKVQVYDPNLP